MEKNQNDKSNQQPGSKSHLEQTQDGKKTQEINPNNPKANQNKQQGSQQGNQQRPGSTSTENKTTTVVQDTEERKEETISEKTGNERTRTESL